jgi:DNA-binding SARP family transcriptional activator
MAVSTSGILRLRAFGAPVIERQDGKPIDGDARQRRVIALIAIVAAARQRGVSRDRVLALLWPESDSERARRALTQALYHTRKALGADDVFLASADLRLNADVISTDVGDFEDAIESRQFLRAVELYDGPYLDGFFVNGAAEFERWVSDERARLGGRYAQALEALAIAAANDSDREAVVVWRRRLAELDPLNSQNALRLMRALAEAGDRAGAIKYARLHSSQLRDELDTAPSPAIIELAEQLRRAPLGRQDVELSQAPNEFSRLPETGVLVPPAASEAPRQPRRRTAWISAALVSAGAFAFALPLTWRTLQPRAGESRNLTVVTPFRVAGADPSLTYLREGLVDLLVAKLIDDSESAAVDPGAVMSAWRQAGFSDRAELPQEHAVRIARQLGGTRVLIGSVVGVPASLVVNATLLDIDGSLRAQASASGDADSLTVILDRLVARLLAKEAGEWERLATRTSTSVPALRAYLDGQVAHRRGGYRLAVRHFRTALERDPSFAMAGLALANAAERLGSDEDRMLGLAAAWAARAELTLRDSVYLDAMAGPRYPAESTPDERLRAWEHAALVMPDRADVWHELGERLFFDGALLGVGDWVGRATAAFRRASELDRGFASPVRHLVQLAAAAGDSIGVRRAAAAFLQVDSAGDMTPFVRWRVASARGDSTALRALRRQVGAFPAASLRWIILSSLYSGAHVADADSALGALRNRAARASDRADALLAGHALALNSGRLDEALELSEALDEDPRRGALARRLPVLAALYGSGEIRAGLDAAARLARAVDLLRQPSIAAPLAPNAIADACVLGQWRAWDPLADGDHLEAQPQPVTAKALPHNDRQSVVCAALIDAIVAVRSGSGDAGARVAHYDSLLRAAPAAEEVHDYGALALARLHALLGDNKSALAAVRRRPYMRQWPHYLSAYLFDEARLAVATGDSAGAVAAYRHYLALRRSPVGRARKEVEVARDHLNELQRRASKQ